MIELSPLNAHAATQEAGGPTLVDLRTHAQHSNLRPPDAFSLPAGEPGTLGLLFRFSDDWEDDVAEAYPLDTPLLLLCDVGVISRFAATRLLEAGHTSVAIVAGGFEAWSLEESLPTAEGRPAEARWPAEEDERPLPSPDWKGPGIDPEEAARRDEAAGVVAGAAADAAAEGEGSIEDVWDAAEEEEAAAVPESPYPAQQEVEYWGPGSDGTPSLLQPRPYGYVDRSDEEIAAAAAAKAEAEAAEKGDDDDDERLGLGDLESLLEEGSAAATSRGKGAVAAAEAAAEEDAESAAVAPDLNALAGDELDDSLAEMVASLDAPVRPPAGSVLPKTLTSNGIKAPGRPPNENKPRGRPGRKRGAGGVPPAWLVDTSGVDFVQMHSEGRLSKLSVKELKSFLYSRDEALSGNKKELTQRVAKCIEEKGGDGGAGGDGAGGAGGGGGGGGGPVGMGGDGVGGASGVAAAPPPYANGAAAGLGGSLGASAGAAAAGVGADGASGDESDELAVLSGLPPPTEGEGTSSPLSMATAGPRSEADAADDFLIDEIFSAM